MGAALGIQKPGAEQSLRLLPGGTRTVEGVCYTCGVPEAEQLALSRYQAGSSPRPS
jgi:hypothetical protein